MVVYHAGRIINSQTNLILPFAGLGPPKPDPVFPKLTGNVRNDLPHVQPLARAIVSPVTGKMNTVPCLRFKTKTTLVIT